jgi:hypothetical protein
MEGANTSEMLVNFYQTTKQYNPEQSHLCIITLSQAVNIAEMHYCKLHIQVFCFIAISATKKLLT